MKENVLYNRNAMKFVVTLEHRRYFREHGFIEFEDLLTLEKLKEINDEIDRVLATRTGAKAFNLKKLPPAEVYPYSRNLWMESDEIKKFDCQSRFSESVLSLLEKKELLLGYDQLLIPEHSEYRSYYSEAFPEELPLNEISSVQGIECGLIVCLSATNETPLSFFPTKAGNVTFVDAFTVMNFDVLKENRDKRFLLIAFAGPKALYLYQEKDPNTHFNKQKGYSFGDHLFKKGHPRIRSR